MYCTLLLVLVGYLLIVAYFVVVAMNDGNVACLFATHCCFVFLVCHILDIPNLPWCPFHDVIMFLPCH